MTDASLVFDILIVDGAGYINNPVSDTGLWLAEKIYTLYKPSIAAQMWLKGMEDFIKELHIAEKQVNILREPDGEFDTKAFKDMVELAFPYELSFVKCAPELENAGMRQVVALRPLPDHTAPQCGSGTFRRVHLKWQFVTS